MPSTYLIRTTSACLVTPPQRSLSFCYTHTPPPWILSHPQVLHLPFPILLLFPMIFFPCALIPHLLLTTCISQPHQAFCRVSLCFIIHAQGTIHSFLINPFISFHNPIHLMPNAYHALVPLPMSLGHLLISITPISLYNKSIFQYFQFFSSLTLTSVCLHVPFKVIIPISGIGLALCPTHNHNSIAFDLVIQHSF